MRSIRVFLATSIVALLILFNFVAAVHGYQSSMREADALFDNQMLDLAKLVSNLDVSNDRLHSLQILISIERKLQKKIEMKKGHTKECFCLYS